jgi:hypothetical protein
MQNKPQIALLTLYSKLGLPHLRLGQFFVSRYIKSTWPELFYETDNFKAMQTINQWLTDHHYVDELPQPVYKLEEVNGYGLSRAT